MFTSPGSSSSSATAGKFRNVGDFMAMTGLFSISGVLAVCRRKELNKSDERLVFTGFIHSRAVRRFKFNQIKARINEDKLS